MIFIKYYIIRAIRVPDKNAIIVFKFIDFKLRKPY